MLCAAPGDDRSGPAFPELAPVLVMVIAAVSDDLIGSLSRSAAFAGNRANSVGQREQLGDVVAVPAGQGDGERDAAGIDDQVMF